jgi:hypothetical protein
MAQLFGKQIVKLGKRLRDAEEPAPGDLTMLGEVLIQYDQALIATSAQLHSIGLQPTTRLKTSGTIIDKLRRQPAIDLKHIHDLAGARIVQPMTLDQQDAVASEILNAFPGSKLLDRRETPSFGYRAVHVIAHVENCPVEIQLRTHYQDVWAQAMEWLGDRWGRAIRYGGEPDDGDALDGGVDGSTRRETVDGIRQIGDGLHALASVENHLERLRAQAGNLDEIEELEKQISTTFGAQKAAYDALRRAF